MYDEEIKLQVKADLGGVLSISPEAYNHYLDWLANTYHIGYNEARDIAREALSELPSYLD